MSALSSVFICMIIQCILTRQQFLFLLNKITFVILNFPGKGLEAAILMLYRDGDTDKRCLL